MQIVKKSKSIKVNPAASTTILEYPINDSPISGAVATIHGRYPEKEYCYNEESTELVYVLSGQGKIVTRSESLEFSEGDLILIQPNEQYYWSGNFKIFMANTPKFDSKQHKIVYD